MDESTIKRQFGEAVRDARQALKLSQEDLAYECGLHRTYVGSVERGERNVAIVNVVRIARAFGMEAAELVAKAGL